MFRQRLIPIVVVALVVSSLLLAACDGMARVNVDVDPDTGQGTIDISGGGDDSGGDTSGNDSTGDTSNNDDGVENAIIFATVIALLLGVTAIVVSLANRPRHQA